MKDKLLLNEIIFCGHMEVILLQYHVNDQEAFLRFTWTVSLIGA